MREGDADCMSKFIRKGVTAVGILAFGAVLGALLLTLAFCLPVDRMYDSYLTNGLESIGRREGWHRYLYDYDATTLDNCTEQLMLKVASTPLPSTGENIFQKAMRCYTVNSEWNHGLTFLQYEWKGENLSCDSYERYWHGYAVVLKPLLIVFDYTDIVFINIAMQFFMMFFLLLVLDKRNLKYLQAGFVILWIVSMQMVIMLCLDYSVCFYIYMFATLLLVCFSKCQREYIWFFMITGMVTSYFDLLTWPLITLAVPLIVLLCMNQTESVKEKIKKGLLSAFFWGIGYIGQWMSKWVIATLVLSDNIIVDAVKQFVFRSSSSSEGQDSAGQAALFRTMQRNFSVFSEKGFVIVLIMIIVYLVWYLHSRKGKISITIMVPFIMVALFPLGWYLVTRNHSYVHYWMTWRNITISIFSISCGVLYCASHYNKCCIGKKT